jgi:hypothetical protein
MQGPIPVSTANIMIEDYIRSTEPGIEDLSKKTWSVSFTGKELMDWLVEKMPFADELRICFGKYPKDDPNGGRVSVILWPYKDGKPATEGYSEDYSQGKDEPVPPPPIPPYNNGGLQP